MMARPVLEHQGIIANPQPDLRARPGQFFLAIPRTFDPYLPQVVYPFRIRDEHVESFCVTGEVELESKQGVLKLRGPYGNGFGLGANPRRALVLAANPANGAPLVPLIQMLIARGSEVAALAVPNAMLERWLPPEVELHVEYDVLAAASRFWGWADCLYAGGESAFYDKLAMAVKESHLPVKEGWGQLLLQDVPTPCGIGICYLCAFRTRRGMVLNCHDGPVYDLTDWIIEG
jgi:hypothetical protein